MKDSQILNYDVVIAGGGPAGSSLAIRLARSGLHVLLVEQKRFPREKLCGEFISPECLSHLTELGVDLSKAGAKGTEIDRTVFFARGGRSITIPSSWFDGSGRPALGLSRSEFDLVLLNRAKDVGAAVLEETTVSGIKVASGQIKGVLLKSKDGFNATVYSGIAVDATGRNRALAKFIRNDKRSQASHVAFKTHLENAKIVRGDCEIYSYDRGYGGCNTVENGLVNVCFIVSAADARNFNSQPERAFRELLMSNVRARLALNESAALKPWIAVPIDRYGRGLLAPATGLLSVGDAAAFIDPFTGSGILLALESSKVAASTLINWFTGTRPWSEFKRSYEREYSLAVDSRLRFSSQIRTFAYSPIFATSIVTALGISETLRRNVAMATRA